MKYALVCPVCSESLSIDKTSLAKHKSLSCSQKHLFDFSKQGYLNLLLSHNKKSKHPGDTLEMVQARTHFLNGGFYDSICDFLITECIEKNITFQPGNILSPQPFNYTDLACGEGFYTDRVHNYLHSQCTDKNTRSELASIGLDISSPAIKAACQRNNTIQWLIASLARIPLENNSQDLVTGLFFHFDFKEINRVLKPGGVFIMATTGPNHLFELRELIYDRVKEEKLKDFSKLQHILTHAVKSKCLTTYKLNSSHDILSLLAMTPHFWRCTQDKKNMLKTLSELSVTIDIQFDIFIKKNSL